MVFCGLPYFFSLLSVLNFLNSLVDRFRLIFDTRLGGRVVFCRTLPSTTTMRQASQDDFFLCVIPLRFPRDVFFFVQVLSPPSLRPVLKIFIPRFGTFFSLSCGRHLTGSLHFLLKTHCFCLGLQGVSFNGSAPIPVKFSGRFAFLSPLQFSVLLEGPQLLSHNVCPFASSLL